LDDYGTDSEESGSDDSYFDAEAMAEDYATTKAYFESLRVEHSKPGYVPTGSLIADSYA